MATGSDVIDRWVDTLTGRNTRTLKCSNVFFSGDVLYSYGHHFWLARALRGKDGALTGIIMNGDTYSVTTSKHQSWTRHAVARSGVRSVIIPASALAAADIDVKSIELVNVTADNHQETVHTFDEVQPGWVWNVEPIGGYLDLSDEQMQAIIDERNAKARAGYEACLARWNSDDRPKWMSEPPELHVQTVADLSGHDRRKWHDTLRCKRVLYTSGRKTQVVEQTYVPETGTFTYSYTTRRHWLGESLIRAKTHESWTEACKACKRTPGRAAEGPIMSWEFASALRRTTGEWFDMEAYNTSLACDNCRGRGTIFRTRDRWAYYLSGFDRGETRPSYFFCELPRGPKPKTVEEAYDALKPDPVRIAEQMGRDVKRQGDIFAISLSRQIDKRSLRKAGASFEKRGQLLGTNHVASEVARMPDGTTLVRGTLIHAPEFRRPDHRRVPLGDAFHVVVKNTVPVS